MIKSKKILAVASGGGHWIQLMCLVSAFDAHKVEYVSTDVGYQDGLNGRLHVVIDGNFSEKLKLVRMFLEVAVVILKVRPDIVVTTGAAPGFAAIFFGRLIGARTVWIDSIANAEELSMSGKYANRWASAWVTQWQHLATDDGPEYWGSVL